MEQYHSLLKRVLGEGQVQYEPRTQEFILGLPGAQSEYNLQEGFPLVTTKRVPLKYPGEELLWKLRGERSVKGLSDRGVHIWDANAFQHWLKRENLVEEFPKHSQKWGDKFKEYSGWLKTSADAEELGDLGPVYGYQWRHGFEKRGEISEDSLRSIVDFVRQNEGDKVDYLELGKLVEGVVTDSSVEIDQLKNVLDSIKNKRGSRYHLMSAWNPSTLPDQVLGPCPMIHQFSVFRDTLHLNVYQRSCDVFLGVPFNIAQDSLMLEMVAKESELPVGKFVHSYGNVHAYLGVEPRSDFWTDPENVAEFQKRFGEVASREGYSDLKAWYESAAPRESNLNLDKDHIPYILTQLSKEPRELPTIELSNVGFWDAIQMPVGEVATVNGYAPHKWKSKAEMAA